MNHLDAPLHSLTFGSYGDIFGTRICRRLRHFSLIRGDTVIEEILLGRVTYSRVCKRMDGPEM